MVEAIARSAPRCYAASLDERELMLRSVGDRKLGKRRRCLDSPVGVPISLHARQSLAVGRDDFGDEHGRLLPGLKEIWIPAQYLFFDRGEWHSSIAQIEHRP